MSTIQDFSDLKTVKEAAEEFGITTARVRQICIDNNIGSKRGRDRFLTPDDMDKLQEIRTQPKKPQNTFTVSEAAERLGVSDSRIRQLCLENGIGEIKGRDRFISDKGMEKLKSIPRKIGRPKKEI
ncbi:Helix-turn-helix domain protein [Gimesia fumaroli]|uniref:Helix-turn-helix domain protein n=2 Tax=Gimesia fumaroli TaxID=2527976 RepID=A0A518I970_9PLAN|nr:Helix-turn-helix domain protein [Gimesia fumaroli]